VNFRFVAQCLNQLRQRVPPLLGFSTLNKLKYIYAALLTCSVIPVNAKWNKIHLSSTAQGIQKEVLFPILYIYPLTVNNACTLITTLNL